MTLRQLYIRFFFVSCIVLPMQVIDKIVQFLLEKVDPKFPTWVKLMRACFYLPGKLLDEGLIYHKKLTVQLNKQAPSNKAFAYKTLCIILGIVIIVLTLGK